jgi:hypothetical protein
MILAMGRKMAWFQEKSRIENNVIMKQIAGVRDEIKSLNMKLNLIFDELGKDFKVVEEHSELVDKEES